MRLTAAQARDAIIAHLKDHPGATSMDLANALEQPHDGVVLRRLWELRMDNKVHGVDGGWKVGPKPVNARQTDMFVGAR